MFASRDYSTECVKAGKSAGMFVIAIVTTHVYNELNDAEITTKWPKNITLNLKNTKMQKWNL
jgi:hypothetical protein